MEPEAWEPVSLPFTKPMELIPTKLPTAAEIRASHSVLNKRTGQTIVAVNNEVLVKFGKSTPEREGQTLLFLERYVPQVPAPRLYAMYYDAGDLFIVMEYISGVPLDRVWENLSSKEKMLLTTQLRTVFNSLRDPGIPCPGYFGAIDGGPVPHFLFFSNEEGHDHITGPFSTEQHFNAGLVAQYKRLKDINQVQDFKSVFYARHLDNVLHNHKPTLTHCDVQKKNIIVTEVNDGNFREHRLFAVTLVDWEDAGWYPEYWEYFSVFTAFRWDDDWCQRLEDFITAWPTETAMMKMIYTDLWF